MFYSRAPKTSHFPVVSYCFLCRKNLVPISGNSVSRPENWELNLVAIPDPPPKRRVLRAALEPHSRGTDDRLILDGAKVKVCDVPLKAYTPCYENGPVYVAHRDCWSLAVGAGKTHIGLYRFAANLQHVIPPRYTTQPPPRGSLPADFRATTDLGRLVYAAAMRLPAEMQNVIVKYLGGHLVSSLLRASQTIASYVKETPRYQVITHVTLATPERVESLYVKTTTVFGLNYLTEIGFNKREGDFIDARRSGFCGMRFALGTYGIRALRILYENGSTSPWLGDPRFSWFGEVYGTDLRCLSVVRDELRILMVKFEAAYRRLGPNTMAQTLWSHEIALRRDLEHSTVTLGKDRGHPVFYEDWSLHGYLQLGEDQWYTSGLTVYCHESSILGILSHSDPAQMIGVPDGHPIYFSLRSDEKIVGVWVNTHMPEQHGAFYQPLTTGPCLLVATSLGRSKYFGEYGETVRQARHWTPLIRRGSVAMGLYFDGSSFVCTTAATSTMPPRTHRLRMSTGLVPPRSHRSGKGVVFASHASLTATRSLKVCMNGDVYAGLLVLHHDDTSEAVGCWDASGKSPVRTIYDSSDGPLMRLAFRLGERESVSRVVEITPVVGDSRFLTGCVTLCVLSIVWWSGTSGDSVSNKEWVVRDMPADGLPHPVHRANPGSEAWLSGSTDF